MKTALAIITRWWWVFVIHGFFIVCMWHFFYVGMTPWKVETYRALGLSFEMNYAVWWSGICLYLASLIYFRIAQLDTDKRMPWLILGAVALALFMDEVGSLHETVSEFAGWLGLLPFGLILGAGFAWSIFKLIQIKGMRISAVLIFTGVFIFAAVAGLEYIEHNVESNYFYARLRLLVEESIELVAMGILVIAGLIAYRNSENCMQHSQSFQLSSISGVISEIISKPEIMYLLFGIQVTLVTLIVIPNFSLFPFSSGEGNLTVLYPVLLFLSLGLFCLHQQFLGNGNSWLVPGYALIITSLFQVFNFVHFLNGYFLTEWEWFSEPFYSWSATFITWTIIVIFTFRSLPNPIKTVFSHLSILLLVMAFLAPGDDEIHFLFRLIDCHYFLFSSCLSFSCYQLLMARFQTTLQK